jgi:hypothetical protein
MDAKTTNANWATAVPAWLDSLGGKTPSRRRLRKFREFCEAHNLGEVDEGMGVARALDEVTTALQLVAAGTLPRPDRLETEEDLHRLRLAYRAWCAARVREREAATREAAERREADLAKRLDEPGFTLRAGENDDDEIDAQGCAGNFVFAGTLRECRDNLHRVTRKRRDPSSGLGCWVIVSPEGEEVYSGTFDADCYY